MKILRTFTCFMFLPFMLAGCLGTPDGVKPVSNFDADAYLGTWYEIARLDHSFERDLSRVTAEYSRREDGGIRVINQGFSEQKAEWKSAEGRAYFIENDNIGHLKVSFLAPMWYSGWIMKTINTLLCRVSTIPIYGCWPVRLRWMKS